MCRYTKIKDCMTVVKNKIKLLYSLKLDPFSGTFAPLHTVEGMIVQMIQLQVTYIHIACTYYSKSR